MHKQMNNVTTHKATNGKPEKVESNQNHKASFPNLTVLNLQTDKSVILIKY